MFWGITLETTKRYTQVVADDFHVSMAALEPRGQSSKGPNSQSYISVMLEREKAEFLLCNLHPDKLIQQSLDLQFIQGEEITFFLTGEGVVHLSGYMTGGDDAEEFDEGSSDSEEEDVPNLVGKRKANQLPNKLQAKKQKIEVDSDDDDSDEDDDSDDEDSDSSEAEENASPKKLPQPSKGQNFKDNLVQSLQIVGSKGLQARSTPKQPQIPGGKQQQTPGGKQQQTPGGKQLQTPGGKQQQTPGGKQQGNKQTPKPGQQSPKKQQQQGQQKAKGVNGRDALDISDSLKKKRKRNKKSKGNVTLNTSDTSASPSTPAKTPAMVALKR